MRSRSQSHSHRSTTKTIHKPFKSKKATKGSLKEIQKGKVTDLSHRKVPHQQMITKLDRRNQNRQKQLAKHKEHLRETNIFAGQDGAARIVAVIPLCLDTNAAAVVRSLSTSLDIKIEVFEEGLTYVNVDRFKQKIQYVVVKRHLMACLDASRIADYVIFVLSPNDEVDQIGEMIIRSVESQGISTVFTVVQGLNMIEPVKKRACVLTSLKSYMNHFLPGQEKIHNLDSEQDCANLMRALCTTTPKGVHWRDERSWMLVDEVKWLGNSQESVVLTGIVRGKGLKADRLIQVGDFGSFQIEKITTAPPARRNKGHDSIVFEEMDTDDVLETPGKDQDDLIELAPEVAIPPDDMDTTMSGIVPEKRGVLLDDHHYFSDEETHSKSMPKRLPKGTSAYQSAWFLGDESSDSESDYEDVDEQGDLEMNTLIPSQDGMEDLVDIEPTEAPSLYAKSEAFLDPNPDDESEAQQLAAFRARITNEAENDREFPDEIELHPRVLARELLARYRGLKSLRTSTWEEDEDRAHEPQNWRRLLQVQNYKSTRSRVTREALVGGIAAGKRVRIYLRDVPLSFKSFWTDSSRPLSCFSCLRHEHKLAVVNFSVTLNSNYPEPIKSKTEMVLQCGPRRFVINPIFSQGGKTPNDVHKFDRFLHPGQTAVATFVAPLTWGSIPSLLFMQTPHSNEGAHLTLVGTCTSLPPSSSRIIAKRVILTGHPYKIHKRLVTIRYMFFNREDVEWFKALQLWTKRGRSGYIKETLGTHGYFKATFDGKINPQDTIGVSLYKRVWPRDSRAWREANESKDVDMDSK